MIPEQTFSSPYFAAVDLGSNSFHLLVARLDGNLLEKVDREKEMVQLADGLQEDGNLSEDARARALACLSRFSERLREIPASQVRVVGTKTLRDADAAGDFLVAAEQALGHPIAVISGFEEARLVYSGLSHSVSNDSNQRLVIDIGGASTEFIIGCDNTPELLESLGFGCVSITKRFLRDGLNPASMRAAYLAVCENIEYIRTRYSLHGWDIAYGTSGTMRAIAELTANDDGSAVISAKSLNQLMDDIKRDGALHKGNFAKQRRAVLPAGIIILKAIFDVLELETIHISDATLKEGLIYDTLGRLSDDDARAHSVIKLQQQYRVDNEHAARVRQLSLHLWRQLEGPTLPGVSRTKLLGFAAELHEVGLGISHSGHQNHGFYVLFNSDIAGFGRFEQQLLAHLIGCHRKKINGKLEQFAAVTLAAITPLLICLRLAVILHRGREGINTAVDISLHDHKLQLSFDDDWLNNQPLTQAGLKQEAQYLAHIGIVLTYENALTRS
ncbi:MAG: Ppx/GppA phosphatase family protein [Marinagarivorans sp.]|nr:Ppx/GppA phosphatase family protein [Marinagarivorans sp.]